MIKDEVSKELTRLNRFLILLFLSNNLSVTYIFSKTYIFIAIFNVKNKEDKIKFEIKNFDKLSNSVKLYRLKK